MLNDWLQEQCSGWLFSVQPYLKARASLNPDLCNAKPWSSIGSEVNHVEAPFSWESSTRCCRLGDNWSYTFLALSFCSLCFCERILDLISRWSSRQLPMWWSWLTILSTSGVQSCMEVLCCSFAVMRGLHSPSPPRRTGRASRSLVSFPGVACPETAGMKRFWIADSSGCIRLVSGSLSQLVTRSR